MAKILPPVPSSFLYRYRSFDRSKSAIDEEIDSIKKKYLFCPPYAQMNDPMEGTYRSSKLLISSPDYNKIVENIYSQKSIIGMSCFSEIKDNLAMWAYYAGGYKGMCIKYSTAKLIAGLAEDTSIIKLS